METTNNMWSNNEMAQLISFDLWSATYGVDINKTLEIIRVPEITRPPLCPDIIEGVINLRWRVIPILNLRKRFGLDDIEKTGDTKIVIMKVMESVSETVIWLVVDFTPEIYRIPSNDLETPESVISWWDDNCVKYIWKMSEKLIQILDTDKIIPEQMRNSIIASAKQTH